MLVSQIIFSRSGDNKTLFSLDNDIINSKSRKTKLSPYDRKTEPMNCMDACPLRASVDYSSLSAETIWSSVDTKFPCRAHHHSRHVLSPLKTSLYFSLPTSLQLRNFTRKWAIRKKSLTSAEVISGRENGSMCCSMSRAASRLYSLLCPSLSLHLPLTTSPWWGRST